MAQVYEDYLNKMQRMFPTGAGGPISNRAAAAVRSQPVTSGALPPPGTIGPEELSRHTQLSRQRAIAANNAGLSRASAAEMAAAGDPNFLQGGPSYNQAMGRANSAYRRAMQQLVNQGRRTDVDARVVEDRMFGSGPMSLTEFFVNLNEKIRGLRE